MGTYGTPKGRPVGNAGHGRHTGKVGWTGGKHRDRGCLGAALMIVGSGIGILAGAGYGLVEVVRAVV